MLGKPKWKKKQSRQAIRFASNAFSVHSQSVKLAKIGHVKMLVSRQLPTIPTSVTIIKDTTGRYFASFVVEVEQPLPPPTDGSCGIDLGLAHFAILSSGEKIDNPQWHKKMLKRIKHAHRRLASSKPHSKRRERRKKKLAKLHLKVKQQRTDFHHKLTTRLVCENQALAVENLNVAGLIKNRKLSRAISDAGWSSFKTMLEAKCDKYGRHLTIVDRWYPSSQICSCCGKSGGRKKLDVREWQCLYCLTVHDRDINASRNLKQQIKKEAGGQSDSYNNGRGASISLAVPAVCDETSTTYYQRLLVLGICVRSRRRGCQE